MLGWLPTAMNQDPSRGLQIGKSTKTAKPTRTGLHELFWHFECQPQNLSFFHSWQNSFCHNWIIVSPEYCTTSTLLCWCIFHLCVEDHVQKCEQFCKQKKLCQTCMHSTMGILRILHPAKVSRQDEIHHWMEDCLWGKMPCPSESLLSLYVILSG